MFGAPGNECIVTGRTSSPAGIAILTDENSLGLHKGDKVRITVTGEKHILEVGALTECTNAANKDHITIHSDTNTQGRSGQYQKIRDTAWFQKKVWGSKKARWSIIGTLLSIASAAGASINASMKTGCSNLHCVTPVTWTLIAISAIAALYAWAKDNLS
jgi:hypothetical protein